MGYLLKAILLFSMLVILASCDDSGGGDFVCGNGILESGEECDGTFVSTDCISLGYYGGNIGCNDDCNFNIDECEVSGRCGDGIINGEEECDGIDVGGASCGDYGYHGGMIGCNDACEFTFGNCELFGYCGNNEVESPAEECDGSVSSDVSCEGMGYYSGDLFCNSGCKIDGSDCLRCGDSVIQSSYDEECDTDEYGGHNCYDLGILDGQVSCNNFCKVDYSLCEYIYQFGTDYDDYLIDGVIADDGDIYVRFITQGQFDPNYTDVNVYHIYVGRLSPYGDIIWIRHIDGNSNASCDTYPEKPILTPDHNVIFPLCRSNELYSTTPRFAKFTRDGSLLWESGDDMEGLLTADSTGFLYIAKSYSVTLQGEYQARMKLEKFTSDGSKLWSNNFISDNADFSIYPTNIKYCNGSLYSAISYDRDLSDPSAYVYKIAVIKYDLNGNELIRNTIFDITEERPGSGGYYSYISALECSGDDGIIIAGFLDDPYYAPSYSSISGSLYEDKIFVGKYSYDLTPLWLNLYGPRHSDIYDIAVDNDNNVFVGGGTFGHFPGYDDNLFSYDFFVSKFDKDGIYQVSKQWDDSFAQQDFLSSIALDNRGNIYLFGSIYGTMGDGTHLGLANTRDYALIQTHFE